MTSQKDGGHLKPMPRDQQNALLPRFAKDAILTERKRKQIVEGACRLFFKKGYHGTTIREIASAAGMSLGQLYHYISSKDDILFLVYRHMQELWRQHLVETGIDRGHDPIEKLKKALRETTAFMAKNKKLLLFIYTESKYLDQRHLKAVLEMDDEEVVGFWRRILIGANEGGEIKGDINLLANIISYLMVFFPMRGWNVKEIPFEETANRLTEFILMGLGLQA